jgi:hypothetical protein
MRNADVDVVPDLCGYNSGLPKCEWRTKLPLQIVDGRLGTLFKIKG